MPTKHSTTEALSENVLQGLKSLRAFVEAGRRSVSRMAKLGRKSPEKLQFGNKLEALKEDAAIERINPDTLKKAQRAAAEFTKEEIDEICGQIKRARTVFASTHFIRLISVPFKKRKSLLKEALAKRWSVAQLERAIRLRTPRRRSGGRRPGIPGDEKGSLLYVESLCTTWQRWHKEVSGDKEGIPFRLFPKRLEKPIKNATKAIDRLHAALCKELWPR